MLCTTGVFSNQLNIKFKFSQPPKGTSWAENASFDVLIDKIRPAIFAVGDNKKRKGKEREGNGRYTKSQDVMF